jgi:hypothetical protein
MRDKPFPVLLPGIEHAEGSHNEFAKYSFECFDVTRYERLQHHPKWSSLIPLLNQPSTISSNNQVTSRLGICNWPYMRNARDRSDGANYVQWGWGMIVGAKLQCPSIRSTLVDRPLLIKKLNQGLHSKLAILIAPAGYGKTTALAHWAKQCGVPTAWISLDRKHNDSFRFWNHVTESIGRLYPNFKHKLRQPLLEGRMSGT